MKRRDFIKSTAAVAGATVASRLGMAQTSEPGPPPNIIFILVDELRWPSVFPAGVNGPEDYFKRFMPNLYRHMWKKGVKFYNYHTAANACTPARGIIFTGLYSHQTWLMSTLLNNPITPVLNPAFPTYGKLLREAGYTTPYVGKWHVSVPSGPQDTQAYGFDWNSPPDPWGENLQGTYGDFTSDPPFHNDAYTANQAISYLKTVKTTDAPFCLTVGFINPHDREFFPAGTEFLTFTDLFASYNNHHPGQELDELIDYTTTPPIVNWATNKLKSPPSYGYSIVPPNWQDPNQYAKYNKPTTHTFIQKFSGAVWGNITSSPGQAGFRIKPYPNGDLGLGYAEAPFYYWQRGLDSYTQVTQLVDQQIGAVLAQLQKLPSSIVDNTVIVFAADHGEYSGAHGLVQGKIGTVYDECLHIPLIVMDPSGRFTEDADIVRKGMCSSVDLSLMLVTLGHKGNTTWLEQAPYSQIYANRHDMYSMLKSRWAPGRDYILFATDEIAPEFYNFNSAPTNIVALQTGSGKVGVYADWKPLSTQIDPSTVQLEYYDYGTRAGRLELYSSPQDSHAQEGYDQLVENYIPNELAQPLPGSPLDPSSLRAQQIKSEIVHLAFRDLIKNEPDSTWQSGNGLFKLLGYGGPF
ncbi:sulfatase-like hydrolase/transferase [Silvibacterium acidisoli]|uniref:sulfatase-like hydrolase/transferase n=1 Tax=Acidobacteriaceae bacterium ZG23-2 TaxID=2883246 RepID=UPI00406CDC1F